MRTVFLAGAARSGFLRGDWNCGCAELKKKSMVSEGPNAARASRKLKHRNSSNLLPGSSELLNF
jgi:hypothetical protein